MRRKSVGEGVQSIRRAMALIETMAGEGPECSLGDLAQRLNLHVSTVHRLLTTLMSLGYVEQNPQDSRYRLGLKMVELGTMVLGQIELRREAAPYLKALSEKTGETANLIVLEQGEVVYIEKAESPASLRFFNRIGKRAPAHCTGGGKALLANLPAAQVQGIIAEKGLPSLTSQTIVEEKVLWKELTGIKEAGYALDNEECEEGVRCVAAPVFNHMGVPVAAVSISGPTFRFSPAKMEEFVGLTREAAEGLSRRLGYRAENSSTRAMAGPKAPVKASAASLSSLSG
ncbi:MAG: IclR family transcriptional regulator [Firmicutes bacterium]|nr:IclR family transcriptional regulator [Bacillota bacterium]